MARDGDKLKPGTKRWRAWAARQVRHIVVVTTEYTPEETETLHKDGLLRIEHLEDRTAIAAAIKELLRLRKTTLAAGGKPNALVPFEEPPGLSSRHGHEPNAAGGK